jgi:hypothetical protein
MYDPMTVAFEIKLPFGKYITIWHVDPCKPGPWRSDDSCGWFMRSGHCDAKGLEQTKKDFEFDWCKEWGGWFNEDGTPRFSTIAITLNMFRTAAKARLGTWKKADKFMKKHLLEIIVFAENPIDSMHDSITGRYGFPPQQERIESAANTVYAYVCRRARPWYKHPRWHVHHWRIK